MMAFRGLSLLVVAFALYNCTVTGLTDCTLPWKDPNVIDRFANICPTPIIGDQNKKYCCYNIYGELACCESKEFMAFGLVWLTVLLTIAGCTCYLCGPCCNGCKRRGRRQAGSLIIQSTPATRIFVEAVPRTISSHTSASSNFSPSISNKY